MIHTTIVDMIMVVREERRQSRRHDSFNRSSYPEAGSFRVAYVREGPQAPEPVVQITAWSFRVAKNYFANSLSRIKRGGSEPQRRMSSCICSRLAPG